MSQSGQCRPAENRQGAAATPASIEKAAVNVELPRHTRFVSVSAGRSDRPDLQSAARVISGGRVSPPGNPA